MTARFDTALRRSLSDPGPAGAAQVFTQGFLNASLLQLAICAPPRQAASTRRYSEIYITELGETVRRRSRMAEQAETVLA